MRHAAARRLPLLLVLLLLAESTGNRCAFPTTAASSETAEAAASETAEAPLPRRGPAAGARAGLQRLPEHRL